MSHFAVQALAVSAIGFAGLWLVAREHLTRPASLAVIALVVPVARWHVDPASALDLFRGTTDAQVTTDSRIAWLAASDAPHAMTLGPVNRALTDNLRTKRPSIRVLTANVHAHNPDSEAFLALVDAERPDVVVVNEMAPHWFEAAERLRVDLPHTLGQLEPEPHGGAIFSRYPLRGTQWLDLGEGRPGYRCLLDLDGTAVEIIALHLDPPVPESAFHRRNDQIQALMQHTRLPTAHRIVVGDLNMSMWSPYHRDLASALGVRNARTGFGVLATWPTFEPPQLRVPIDHVLVSADVAVADARLGPSVGSDHLPLIVDLTMPPTR